MGKFKRFALITSPKCKIKVNETELFLYEFVKLNNLNGNSFQFSFYDINNKYIVSKRINTIENMSFSSFYDKYIKK